jgi:hypothetical protein
LTGVVLGLRAEFVVGDGGVPQNGRVARTALLAVVEHQDALAVPGGQIVEHDDVPGVPDKDPELVADGDVVAHHRVCVR